MNQNIRKMNDEQLAKELAFAKGFADPSPEARRWLLLLEAEADLRKVKA